MTLIASNPTLIDISRQSLPDGSLERQMVDTISKVNEMFLEATVLEGNSPTGSTVTEITSLPTVSFSAINQGVATSKGTSKQRHVTAGIIEGNNQVDAKLVKLNGNTEAYLRSQDLLYAQAMSEKAVEEVVSGDIGVDPKGFDGFFKFYNAISTTKTNPGYNVISAGGSSTDNYSMLWVTWSPETAYMFHPKGLQAGFQRDYLGKIRVTDADGNPYIAHCSNFQWALGLCIANWKYCGRIANIDASDLATYRSSSDSSPDLLAYMTKAIYRIPKKNMGRTVFYAPIEVMEMLENMIEDKATAVRVQDIMNPFGGMQRTLVYKGIPIRQLDALVLETSAVS